MAKGYTDMEIGFGATARVSWDSENNGVIYASLYTKNHGSAGWNERLLLELCRVQNNAPRVESWYWFDYGWDYGYSFDRTFYNTWANYSYCLKVSNYNTGEVYGYTDNFPN